MDLHCYDKRTKLLKIASNGYLCVWKGQNPIKLVPFDGIQTSSSTNYPIFSSMSNVFLEGYDDVISLLDGV